MALGFIPFYPLRGVPLSAFLQHDWTVPRDKQERGAVAGMSVALNCWQRQQISNRSLRAIAVTRLTVSRVRSLETAVAHFVVAKGVSPHWICRVYETPVNQEYVLPSERSEDCALQRPTYSDTEAGRFRSSACD